MQAKLVPATPSVIAWAIRESGFSLNALATLLNLPEQLIDSWTKGKRPEVTQLQAFAAAVHRPFSAFLLPQPPAPSAPEVRFRSSLAAGRRALNPEERQRIREAVRLQHVISWLSREMGLSGPDVPLYSTKDDAEQVAQALRERLSIPIAAQLAWSSAGEALRSWRAAVEGLGVVVLMLPMGEESCRGFSIWDDAAPLIAINSAWLPEARVFTLFHELAHLATRTNSACAEDVAPRSAAVGDRVERWCEHVAAGIAVPAQALSRVLSEFSNRPEGATADLSTAGRVATRFRVSRRAAALRLIECNKASWGLYKSILPQSDQQRRGSGGPGLTRAQLRRQRYGQRTMSLFRDALRQDVLSAADIVDYIDVLPDAPELKDSHVVDHQDD